MHTVKTPTEIEAILKAGVATVVFTKADGSERKLRGTLKESLIPPSLYNATAITHSTTVQTVFDVDANDWRSFKYDSVKAIAPDATA